MNLYLFNSLLYGRLTGTFSNIFYTNIPAILGDSDTDAENQLREVKDVPKVTKIIK